MREGFELAQLAWSRHSRILWSSLGILATGQILLWGLWIFEDPRFLVGLIQLVTFFAGLAGVFFVANWSSSRITLAFSPWLLRQPVTTTQIVLSIVVCKTVWIAVFWIAFLIPAYSYPSSPMPHEVIWLPPILGMTGFVLLFLALVGRPYTSPFRGGVIVIGSIAFYFTVIFTTTYALDQGRLDSSHESLAWLLVTLALYASSIVMLFRTVSLARIETQYFGFDRHAITHEKKTPLLTEGEVLKSIRPFESVGQCRRGLFRLEFQGHFSNAKTNIYFMLLPLVVATTYFGPHPANLFLIVSGFACAGCITSLVGQPNLNDTSTNSSKIGHLISLSPLSSATIGWTRLLERLSTYLIVFSLAVIPFAIWWIFPHQQRELANLATQVGGWRIFFAWIGISSYLALTRIFAAEFCDRFGNAIIAITLIAAGTVFYMLLLGICLQWFFKQSDWDTVWASLESFAKWTTPILAWLCGAKAVATMVAATFSIRRNLYNFFAALGVFAIWLIIVSMGVAVGWPLRHSIWMDGTTLVLACVVATPLARPLLIPWATSINRHR